MADDAGALLVQTGLISDEQLLVARQAQAGRGGTIGEHLVLAGFIDDDKLAEFFRARLMVPQVNARQLANIPRQLIDTISPEMAAEFRCIPVKLDRDENLTLAMADPSTMHIVDEIAFFTRHYVVRAVATQSQIAWCLAHYYGKLTPLAQKLLRDPASANLPGPMPPEDTFEGDTDRSSPSGAIPKVRKPSITSQVQASRHRVLPPMSDLPFDAARPAQPDPESAQPVSQGLDTPPDAPPPDAPPPDAPPPDAPVDRSVGLWPTVEGDPTPRSEASTPSGPVPVAIEPEPQPQRAGSREMPGSERNQRVISFLSEDTSPTGPMRTLMREAVQPPELYDRFGEVEVPTGPIQQIIDDENLPRVMVSLERTPEEDDTGPIMLERLRPPEQRPLPLPEPSWPGGAPASTPQAKNRAGDPAAPEELAAQNEATERASSPLLLETKSAKSSEESDDKRQGDDSVVLLDRPKGKSGPTRRRVRKTQLGLGITPSLLSKLADRRSRAEQPVESQDSAAGESPPESAIAAGGDAARQEAGPESATSSQFSSPEVEPTPAQEAREPQPEPEDTIPEVTIPDVTVDHPTAQMGLPELYPDGWRSDWSDGDPADSIASAAEAAAEAHARYQRSARGSAEAIPTPIQDERFVEPDTATAPDNRDSRSGSDSALEEEPTGQFERLNDSDISSEEGGEDDEWGPPGSTIPPPYIGAVTDAAEGASGPAKIPIFTDHMTESGESIDVMLRPFELSEPDGVPELPLPGEASGAADDTARQSRARPDSLEFTADERGAGADEPQGGRAAGNDSAAMTPELMRQLEKSSLLLVRILRDLDQAATRDRVVDILTTHLAQTYRRVSFFVVKAGKLSTWKKRVAGKPSEGDESAFLSLDEPSTFQDIVGTRLPFRGALHDAASRQFVIATFGSEAGDMLGLPVAVRGRVVGVLYGDNKQGHIFEQHLAVVTRAAGVAFERILKNKKRQ